MNIVSPTGKVILAGAGPGDPDLITIKAANYLKQADIVLVDRLVSKVILQRYVRPGALIVPVGKQCRRGVSTTQETINQLMVGYATEGKLVVRLKGGDISFFSNVLDELETLVQHRISYEIVPGITAASGAAAYAGIPLTARNFATAVRFLTYYQSTAIADAYWKELAQTDDTLVFYMSSETIDQLLEKLIENRIAGDKRIAVIEQATTTYQQVYVSGIYEYAKKLKGQTYLSPSLIIIGKVVSLQENFGWYEGSDLREYYFKPLTSTVKSLINNEPSKQYAGRA
ncbi:MAG: uroporphyrinogen-III C-methyltransferase [Bacteroidota bacterium]|jgi:uroporphyrin-III C-methyltransferase